MKKYFMLMVLAVVFSAGCLSQDVSVSNFVECEQAGYPIMESYPRQCRGPDGVTHTEIITDTPAEPEKPVGGDRDEHGCIGSAGYTWCPASEKCLRIWEEECPLSKDYCEAGGGRFNECGSRCALDNQGKTGVACTMMCEQLCECGSIIGLGCPLGYECKAPEDIIDGMGYCVAKKKVEPGETSGETRARTITTSHVRTLEPFIQGSGRNLEVKKISNERCDGCWSVTISYEFKPSPAAEYAHATVDVVLSDWEVASVKYIKPGVAYVTAKQCLAVGGRLVNSIGGGKCAADELYVGEVSELVSPHLCCVKDRQKTCDELGGKSVLTVDSQACDGVNVKTRDVCKSCTCCVPSDDDDDDDGDDDDDDVVSANNRFAVDLYSSLKESPGNIFYSPYSVSMALAMTLEGAKGLTASEMISVLHLPSGDDARRQGFKGLYDMVNAGSGDYELSTANALWAQKDYLLLAEYTGIVDKYYGGSVTSLDFKTEPEKSRVTINDWVMSKTHDRIKDLIPSGALTPLTRLVLTNAIYFKGTWVMQFNESHTRNQSFRVGPGKTVTAPIMRLTGDSVEFDYTEDGGIQVLKLPYEGGDLSMLVLLPRDDDMELLEGSLSLEKLDVWRNSLRNQRVDVYLPKFKFETKSFMKKILADMGMQTAFTSSADFSGITGTRDLLIDEVIHQAFIEVNEEGTEAAAATAVIMRTTSIGPSTPVFRADHPFIFIIQEDDTGAILFMGKVTDPTK